jgi:hypothetical protein
MEAVNTMDAVADSDPMELVDELDPDRFRACEVIV